MNDVPTTDAPLVHEENDFFNPECNACATYDPEGSHHYHCGRCGMGPTSMLGHYRNGAFTCNAGSAS